MFQKVDHRRGAANIRSTVLIQTQPLHDGRKTTFKKAYNKINPTFGKATEQKPIDAWFVCVGRQEGFIPSADWSEAQKLLKAIGTRYNRPQEGKTFCSQVCCAALCAESHCALPPNPTGGQMVSPGLSMLAPDFVERLALSRLWMGFRRMNVSLKNSLNGMMVITRTARIYLSRKSLA